MPVTTRSASRSVTIIGAEALAPPASSSPSKTKRKAPATPSRISAKKSRLVVATTSVPDAQASATTWASAGSAAPVLVPAVLSFSFEEAKQHLINVDHRFQDLFDKMKCKPFEQLESVHPFRALVKSILAQQISWLAARSINYKFIRLYDPSLPEKPTDPDVTLSDTSFFPSPEQVAKTDLATLKTAGISSRKAEYVQGLAARFADGRLSTEKLTDADDEELAQMLIEVRGIGRWSVDMFAIFSLRRPDILPVGDLGVQRGIVRWFLSLHSPAHPFSISPEKLGGSAAKKAATAKTKSKPKPKVDDEDALPVFGQGVDADGPEIENPDPDMVHAPPDISSVPPTAIPATPLPNGTRSDYPSMPPPFTPSINNTLHNLGKGKASQASSTPLPEGLTVALLKSRLDGKKKIRGAFLTPKEMEALTECWKPYRSLGVFYMWSLAGG